ncbi:MAG TPA: EAL domain-containing protein [Steroidobacteraceae bacterium]
MAISLTILNSLRGRILALVLGLVILVLTAAIVGIAVTERAETERQVGAQLQTAADTARELLRFRGSQLTTAVEVLTSDFGFREAVSSADAATLTSAIENQQRRINADLVIVLSINGRPLASTFNGSLANTQRDLEGLIETDASGETLQLYRLIDGRPYQLVIAPILAPNPIGWAAMGFALDDRVAEDMSRLLGVDVSFVASAGQYPLFIATSDHGDPRTLEAAVTRNTQATPFVVAAGSDKLLTWTRPIRSANGSLILVFQRSLSSALRPYDDIRNSMLLLGAILLVVATILAAWLARSATKPVEDLTRAAQRLEAGDYGVEVPSAGTTELKGLAGAFNAMRAAVADREATIRHQADHHPLTGLPTRARISAILDDLLTKARIDNRPVTVCLAEVQQFQSIIGSVGHAAGDRVLLEVARRLKVHERRVDRVAHIGTDQFLLILESAGGAKAAQQAAAIVDRLHGSFDYEEVSFQLDMRIGAAVFPADGAGAAELMQRADLALHRAKETGSPVGVYLKGDDSSHRHRLSILGELRRAIESNELELHYQPKVKAATGQVVGCEALVRWRHPQHGYIPPSDFVPHAERTGAIRSLTSWVLAAALNSVAGWEREGIAVDVSVNVSPVDFADPGFADNVASLLLQTGADASRVILEITESGAMKDIAATLRMMEQLRVLGLRFSIDDFGTGHSSLAHLKRLPVDEVKIDRSFIKELETQPDDDVIVRSTINLGHALDLKVVAEGVEEASSWDALQRLGCDLIQGYFISKPLPISEFTAWSLARNAAAANAAAAAEPGSEMRRGQEPAGAAIAGQRALVVAGR